MYGAKRHEEPEVQIKGGEDLFFAAISAESDKEGPNAYDAISPSLRMNEARYIIIRQVIGVAIAHHIVTESDKSQLRRSSSRLLAALKGAVGSSSQPVVAVAVPCWIGLISALTPQNAMFEETVA